MSDNPAGPVPPSAAGRTAGDNPAARVRRLPLLVLLVLSLVVAGVLDGEISSPPPHAQAMLASAAAPADAQSSSWYCTGATGTTGGAADPTLYMVNASGRTVHGTVHVVSMAGGSASTTVAVPADSQVTVRPDALLTGTWLATSVVFDGGGVTVSEAVHGSDGWAESPCTSSTSTDWYFPSGSTANGSLLYAFLFNPTSTLAVADIGFTTPQGTENPPAFQGLVLAPGALVVADVASYVQGQSSVATTVQAESGRLVAAELEEHAVGGVSGLSLQVGAPRPERQWSLPRTVDPTPACTAEIVIFNPTPVSERVKVAIQLPSGPVAPPEESLASGSVWNLVTSRLTRVPLDTDYAVTVTATGGAGVAVDRIMAGPAGSTAPQWGVAGAIGRSASDASAHRWVVPSPDAGPTQPLPGASAVSLDLANPGDHPVIVVLRRFAPFGTVPLTDVPEIRIPPAMFTVVNLAAVPGLGAEPILLRSNGPLVAAEEAGPSSIPGIVTMPAVPQR